MYILDFAIPLNREELVAPSSSGQFTVSSSYSIVELREKLEAAKAALTDEGTGFIVDHFSTFYSLFKHFKQAPELVKQKGWIILRKTFKLLSSNLNVLLDDVTNVDSEVQHKMCNITKMIMYALIELMKLHQDKFTDQSNLLVDAKGKKKQVRVSNEDEWNWADERHKVLIEICNFLQMPLKMLWEPPVVEEEFVNLISNFCYKCLEDPSIGGTNLKATRVTIFQILGILIKQYLHGLSFCVKTVQLLRLHEHLVNSFAQGVVQLVKECDCKNVVKEVVREIANTDGDQLASDTVGTRCLNLFLVQLAEAVPEMIIPAIDLLAHHLAGDSYSMRICVLGILGEVVLTTLTKENLDDDLKKLRDEFLDSLKDHIHDSNAFVRTKVLQVWQKLCLAKAIPVSRLNKLLELTIGRLNDKSTYVKKQSVHCIKTLLECNPYSAQLNAADIKVQLLEEKKKLESIREENQIDNADCKKQWEQVAPKLKTIIDDLPDDSDSEIEDETITVSEIGKYLAKGAYQKAVMGVMNMKKDFYAQLGSGESGSDDLMLVLQKIFEQTSKPVLTNISPEALEILDKQEKTVEYLENALQFAMLIDRAQPIILALLDSNVTSDVLEAVHFFTAAYLFGFQQALDGVRKMLYLVFSKEASIKTAVSSAYKDLYFQTNCSGRQHSVQVVKNLSELVLKLNPSQLDALEEVVKEWVKTDVIDVNCIQVLFERFSMKIPGTTEGQSWAALVLIRMVGGEQPKVLKSNISVLLDHGLGERGYKNLLLGKETCNALYKLLPAKTPGQPVDHTLRYPNNHEMFTYIYRLLRNGLWRLDDPYYIPMADEAINTVFFLCNHPDTFCEQLIVELHERISSGNRPVLKKNRNGKVLSNRTNFDDLHSEDLNEPPSDNSRVSKDGKDLEMEDVMPETEVNSPEVTLMLLTRFISILGQVAANYIMFLEGPVLDELKRRNQVDYERKLKKFQENRKGNASMRRGRLEPGSNDSAVEEGRVDKTMTENGAEDLEFNRVAADDMYAEEMKRKTEKEIVNGNGFLAKFTPLILTICMNPGKYNNAALQNAALLSLVKFMQVSSVFCENNLQLLVTICEKGHCPERRVNAIVALGALQYRFPNSLEPWTPHMYAMLRDSHSTVRINSIMVLTDLIVNEMIKARSHISDLAICVVDKELRIAQTARHFFREYSQKGNSLYNVLPNLISNLTQPNPPLDEEEFQTVMRFILGLVTKDKQLEYLVEKMCQYFEAADTERQWKDLAFCLSLLNYTEKGLKKILENLRYFANKLYLADVYESFCTILTNAGKNPQKDKTLIDEIQGLIKEYRNKSCEDRNIVVTIPTKRCPASTRKRVVRRKLMSDSDSEPGETGGRRVTRGRKEAVNVSDEEDDAFLSDASSRKSVAVSTRKKKPPRRDPSSGSSDIENHQQKVSKKVRSKQTTAKKGKTNKQQQLDTSSEDEKPKKPVRSTRKRK